MPKLPDYAKKLPAGPMRDWLWFINIRLRVPDLPRAFVFDGKETVFMVHGMIVHLKSIELWGGNATRHKAALYDGAKLVPAPSFWENFK